MPNFATNKALPKKRCVITGAAGMLGSALVPTLRNSGYIVYATDIITTDHGIDFLDVRDYEAVKAYFNERKPAIVFHLAAETDLEICESKPDDAFITNTLGTQNVCVAAQNLNATLFYISTAGVFDGEKMEPYTEFDRPNPINIYGKTKYEGEKFVEKLVNRYFIVRAGWMIGGGVKDKKFTAKIIKQLRDNAKRLHVVTDKFGTPTYNIDFSRALHKLWQTEYYGLYHAACTGTGSRLDVAREILNFINVKDVELIPVGSEFFQNSYPTPRPRSEILRNYVLDLRGLNVMRPWKDALIDYLTKNYKDIGEAIK